MDIAGPFPESDNKNSYVLVVVDLFTRWTEAFPIPNQEVVIVTDKLVNEVFMCFGIPEVCRLLEIQKSRTTPYHP